MMRTKILYILAVINLAASANAGAAKWQEPTVVSHGRELPRTTLLSYASTDDALIGSHDSSLYLQPLSQGWTRSDEDGGVAFSCNYKVPFAWVDRQLFLHIGAVETAYEVFVNGRSAGYNQSSMTEAEFDVTAISQEGNNTLKVVTYPSAVSRKIENREGLREDGRGSKKSAIEGEVYITAQPRVRVRDYVADTRMEGREGRIELGVIVKSHLLNAKDVRMYYQLYSPVGELVTEGRRDIHIDMRKEDTVRFYIVVPEARAWSHETPNLYTMVVRTQHEGRFMEYLSFRVGLRTVAMNDGKLLINGRAVPLNVAEYTAPLDTALMRRELAELRAGGVNMLKIKALPQQKEFYAMCDQMGFYLCNQADINTHLSSSSLMPGGTPSNDPRWRDAYTDRAKTMYHTSQNHPSVVMFSLAENSSNGYNLYEGYLRLKEIEKNRPVIYPDARGEWNTDAISNRSSASDIEAWRMGLNSQPRLVFGASVPGEIMKSAEPITISAVDAAKGVFRVSNSSLLTPLYGAEVVYTVRAGRRVVAQGSVGVDVIADSYSDVTIPSGKAKPGDKLSYELSVEVPSAQPSYYIHTKPEPDKKLNFIEKVQDELNIAPKAAPVVKRSVAKLTL